ncbi:MAG: phosphoglucosamine mutase [Candidatus Omnitrophica bacterium]|nr:phosphoglucosamine mutase [Candidatus Omnitrophota bacterium]
MQPLKISISGIRGIAGSSFTNTVALEFGQAFGTFVNCGKVAVARDTRTSGDMLKSAVMAGLLSCGCKVIDLGIIPTPTALFYVRHHKVDGGIIVTASHNSAEWNGLKFIDSDGTFLSESRLERLFDIYYKKEFRSVSWDIFKDISVDSSAVDAHINEILKNLDVKAIIRKHFKVGVDYINGTGCVITPKFLSALGCRVFSLNDKPNGVFNHEPEPLPKNLKALCRLVKQKRLHIGFAQDPDADRLAVVSEKGIAIGEELTLGLSVKFILLYRQKGTVVINLSASRILDYIKDEFGIKLIRTKVGEANVVYEMKKRNAIIGGEGSGGVIFPKINYGRDSLVAMGLILEYLAKSDKKISQLVDELPKLEMIKGKFECPFSKISDVLDALRGMYKDEDINVIDGLKVIWLNKWVHIRPSNTEPIIRIIVEAETKKEAHKLYLEVSEKIKETIEGGR